MFLLCSQLGKLICVVIDSDYLCRCLLALADLIRSLVASNFIYSSKGFFLKSIREDACVERTLNEGGILHVGIMCWAAAQVPSSPEEERMLYEICFNSRSTSMRMVVC